MSTSPCRRLLTYSSVWLRFSSLVSFPLQTPICYFTSNQLIFTLTVTGLEYAYTKAPPNMKSFVQSLYLFTSAIGSAISEALVPATGDPAIMWMYTGVSIVAALTGVIFWFIFNHYDNQEEEMNALEEAPADEKHVD
jgi:POT family proton-dependent oligopeptide transporter